jgi:hypothetical protein
VIHRFTNSGDKVEKMAAGQHVPYLSLSDIDQAQSPLKMHDPASPDMAFADRLAAEMVAKSGADVLLYPLMDSDQYDQTWEENANPIYGKGRPFKAFFVPNPSEVQLTRFGIDAENKGVVVFHRSTIFREMGKRMLRIGDVIDLPYNSSVLPLGKYRILNVGDAGNFRYNWLYLSCTVENLTNDIRVSPDHG